MFLAAVDILSHYPDLAENFLRSIKPGDHGQIPAHPVERCLDLFFLNAAEHFPLVLSPEVNEELLLSAAFPYLAAGANSLLLEIFEAAHSVVLVVFAVPHNSDLATRHLPFYIDNLFAVSHPAIYTFSDPDSVLGVSRESVCSAVPSCTQDCYTSHSPSFTLSQQPTTAPVNPP